MEKRAQKQLIIGLIFILILGAIGYVFFDYFFVTEATCFDGVQNGKEDGVDCGTLACGVACEPEILSLNVLSQKFIEVRPGDYDFVAQINNPNSLFGASRVGYTLDFDGTMPDKSGTFYILPGQTRFIIISDIRSDSALANASINIAEVEWEKVKAFENLSFLIQRKSYAAVNKDGIFSELEAVVFNNSDYDFDKVEVGVILFSAPKGRDLASGGGATLDDIIGVNRTDIRTFLSRTERYFKVSWPVELPKIVRQDVEVLTNVFENANFIRRHGTQEKFQKYY